MISYGLFPKDSRLLIIFVTGIDQMCTIYHFDEKEIYVEYGIGICETLLTF